MFEGKPDLDALRTAVAQQDITGAFVRVRWTVAEEDRGAVDRDAIQRILAGAAETKLEGRIVPVVRTRMAGISRMARMEDKLRAWAQVSDINPEPLLACLAALEEARAAAGMVTQDKTIFMEYETVGGVRYLTLTDKGDD